MANAARFFEHFSQTVQKREKTKQISSLPKLEKNETFAAEINEKIHPIKAKIVEENGGMEDSAKRAEETKEGS